VRAPCMTLATVEAVTPSTWWSLSPAIAALDVVAASPPICPTWSCRTANTPAKSSKWPSAWSSRMAWITDPPLGTSGATIGSLSPTPPSRTGSRPQGGKILDTLRTGYLDNALAPFSGYLAIDEVYDG